MEQRKLDLTEAVTPEQWEILGRTAAELGVDGAGFDWDEEESKTIDVYMRDSDAPNYWRELFVSRDDTYGDDAMCVARFDYAGGTPVAEIDVDNAPDEPVYTNVGEATMQQELERWVRNKWHELMERSGIHFDRGHMPQS